LGGRGDLYVTEISPGKHRVLILDTDGHVRAQFGKEGKGNGELSFPTGIAVDGSGLIYVADGNNGRVVTLDPVSGFGEPLHAPAGFNLPRGLSMLNGQLLVSDTTGQRVLAFSLGGVPRFLYSFGDEGAMDGQFEYPEGVAVDSTGRVYVADRMNDRIQVFGWR
ncbi:MAG: NHL repeat-containing protein, partial [Bacteroidetes bacterium]|nr:NHL repeat-containing protein [Bacteroidota bacterium]